MLKCHMADSSNRFRIACSQQADSEFESPLRHQFQSFDIPSFLFDLADAASAFPLLRLIGIGYASFTRMMRDRAS